MAPILSHSIPIPSSMQANWQQMLNLLAEVLKVSATLIMRLRHHDLDVFCTSVGSDNPYQVGMTERLGTGLYCETVVNTRQILLVSNADLDPLWKDNPDLELGMRAYCGVHCNGQTVSFLDLCVSPIVKLASFLVPISN